MTRKRSKYIHDSGCLSLTHDGECDCPRPRERRATVPEPSDEVIEIRCLWNMTDYGHISLLAAARGYGGRELGSYQDAITDKEFECIRHEQIELHGSAWPCAEGIVKVRHDAIAALFPGVLETEGAGDA